MKIGEIKIEALKMMFANDYDMSIDDIPKMMGNETMGSYLIRMNGSINRALDRIQNAYVIPTKSYYIEEDELVECKFYNRFDTTLIEDLDVIERVSAESGYMYNPDFEYRMEEESLILQKGWEYTIIYYPIIPPVDIKVRDDDELELPDYVARLIPYFIKSELYQEDEPSLAADARNVFEMSLDDLKYRRQGRQNRVKRVL
jgi:hypothetical protein